jgi:DNA-binding LacI/PurR family transcriptional regulator
MAKTTTSARPSLRAIADELGVSTMTVSNAYNRPAKLSEELRERVFEMAGRLGYPGPNPLARGLRRGQTGALGMIHDTKLSYAVRDPAVLGFLGGVGDAAEAARLRLLLISGEAFDVRDSGVIGDALVDGLIVYSVADGDPLVAAALHRRIPTVIVDQPTVPNVPLVGVEDRAGARTAGEHLLALGHRRLGVVSLPLLPDRRQGPADRERQQSARYPVHRARLAGYAEAVEAAGFSWSDVRVYECAGSTVGRGRDAGATLLDDDSPPTAILAAGDQLALGVIEAARDRGIVIPDQLSIVGFDDIPAAAATSPALTTVRQDHGRKGQLAVDLLLAKLAGESPTTPPLLQTELIARRSTRPPIGWKG